MLCRKNGITLNIRFVTVEAGCSLFWVRNNLGEGLRHIVSVTYVNDKELNVCGMVCIVFASGHVRKSQETQPGVRQGEKQ